MQEAKADACGMYAAVSVIFLIAMSKAVSKIMRYLKRRIKMVKNLIGLITVLGCLHKRYQGVYLPSECFLVSKPIF